MIFGKNMEIRINAMLFHSPKNIEIFPISVNQANYKLIIKKLESERNKIVKYLKSLKSKGEIKSVFRPKNKAIQSHLNEICKIKKEVKRNIEKLKTIYK